MSLRDRARGHRERMMAGQALVTVEIRFVTDYDVGVDDIPPVTHEEVLKVFGENIDKVRDLLFAAVPAVPAERTCPCATALAGTGNG